MGKIGLVYPLTGQVAGKKDEFVEISALEFGELEALLKVVAKVDRNFERSEDVVSVEFSYQGVVLFIDIIFSEYKRLCDLYFKEKIKAKNSNEEENELA